MEKQALGASGAAASREVVLHGSRQSGEETARPLQTNCWANSVKPFLRAVCVCPLHLTTDDDLRALARRSPLGELREVTAPR